MTKKTIAITCASAFWGDTPLAIAQVLRAQDLDYIVFDYLSEITMTLLARLKKRDAAAGYCPDFFTDVIEPHLETIASRKIKLISNAGGMNPLSLKKKIQEFAESRGLSPKITCVLGDDLVGNPHLPAEMRDAASANAYLGAKPIAEALKNGSDIVITGRVVDSALALGPAASEFGWKWTDYDLLAQGSLAGHIIECGTQCCGGNFTDWQEIPRREDMGFPIARISSDGSVEIGKAPDTGGAVTEATVAEQIVYEIGNPSSYELPDVICDFTQVQLKKKGADLIEVSGAKGRAPSENYKALATRVMGSKIAAAAFMAGAGSGDAREKARSVGEAVLSRSRSEALRKGFGDYSETLIEALGGPSEALLRICAAHAKTEALEILAKEIAPAATSLAPGLTGLLGGRASPSPRIQLNSFLFPKSAVNIAIDDGRSAIPIRGDAPTPSSPPASPPSDPPFPAPKRVIQLPLKQVAYARSGDKGNDVNIGVIARKPSQLPGLKWALTTERVRDCFSKDFDDPASRIVQAWELPGIHALNFLLKNCLGGGGAYSLRIDPQGKAYGQRLLEQQIPFPEDLL